MLKVRKIMGIILACTITVIVIVLLGMASEKMKNVYDKEIITDNAEIRFGKRLMKRGKITDYSLKGNKYGDTVTIKTKMGKCSHNNPVLMFNNFIEELENTLTMRKYMNTEWMLIKIQLFVTII